MARILPTDFSSFPIFPDQELEGKVGYFTRIKTLYPGPSEEPGSFRVVIENPQKRKHCLYLNREEFQQFLGAYGADSMAQLLEKTVVAIYSLRVRGARLTGLIPLTTE